MRMLAFLLLVFEQCMAADRIEELACQHYAHGVPYQRIVVEFANEPATLYRLEAILLDKSKKHCWSNSAWMLGILGTERQVRILIGSIFAGTGNIDSDEWGAKITMVLALGLLANKGGTEAIVFLEMLVSREAEKMSLFSWRPRGYTKDVSLNVQVARVAVQALGLSGRPEARVSLERRRGSPRLIDVVKGALSTSHVVEKYGLAHVYK